MTMKQTSLSQAAGRVTRTRLGLGRRILRNWQIYVFLLLPDVYKRQPYFVTGV